MNIKNKIKLFHDTGNGKIYCGHVIDVLKQLPDKSIQCCVTSPPYWGLRQYFFDGAVILRRSLTLEEKEYVLKQLKKYEIKSNVGGRNETK